MFVHGAAIESLVLLDLDCDLMLDIEIPNVMNRSETAGEGVNSSPRKRLGFPCGKVRLRSLKTEHQNKRSYYEQYFCV